ncbi:MAG: acyltransferase [Terracidiphilus sp.]|jgi:peptidoglycan/LPS O-acetylase OafA/YrhL
MSEFVEPPATLRFDGIDVLRGYSIIAVVLLHGQLRLLYNNSISIENLVPHWLFPILFGNGDGVTVFFAVSGFLITLTSIRRFGSLAKMRAAVFYRIRFARIAPLLLLLLAVLSLLHIVHANGFRIPSTCATLPRALIAALTFHVNWLEAAHGYLPANWDVLWSLSIEEMFYLFFPLACVLLLRWRRGMLLLAGLLLCFAVMGPFARTVWTTNPTWRNHSYLGGMSGIALGCLTALLIDRLQRAGRIEPNARSLWVMLIGGALLMLPIVLMPGWIGVRLLSHSGLEETVISLGACLVIMATVLRGRKGRAWSVPVRWFGRHSYEVYLTHEFVVVWVTALYVRVQRGSPLVWIAAELALCAPLGAAVARWYSEPMNRLLRGAAPPAR